MRYDYTPITLAQVKKIHMTIPNADEDAKQLEHSNIAGGNSTLETFWQFLTKLNLQVFILET